MTLRNESSFPRGGTGDSESQLGRGEPAATGRGAGLGAVAGEDIVVLWHGQYYADAMERWQIMDRYERALFGLRNARVVGHPGEWQLLAEATRVALPGEQS